MRLSKESQLLELNTRQLNRRLKNVLDQKLQVLETLKEEQRRGHERTMTQLVLRTARYHHRIEEIQDKEVFENSSSYRRKVSTKDKGVETVSPGRSTREGDAKLPPLHQHTNCKSKMFSLMKTKQHAMFQRHYRLPPI